MSLINMDIAPAAIAERIGQPLRVVLTKIALDLHTKITERTPVDTGRLRASFQITAASPTQTTPPSGQYPRPASPPLPKITGEEPIFIASALPYAEAIENGHSAQAPAGMVAISIIETEAELAHTLAQL